MMDVELITDLEQSKYQHSEWRLSIYGRYVHVFPFFSVAMSTPAYQL